MILLFKSYSYVVLEELTQFSSCQYFAGEYPAEEAVLVHIARYPTNECDITLYSDNEYIARVHMKDCQIYLHSVAVTETKEK